MNPSRPDPKPPYPSGEQFALQFERQRAVVTEVGATLRSFSIAGQEFLDTFPLDQISGDGRGQVLLPWPNRLDRGTYTFEEEVHQLPVNEAAKQNAIHGLTRWLNWRLLERTSARVVLGLVLHPQPGYPFTLALELTYTLSARGLEVHTTAHNVGSRTLPFGGGQHPYFTLGLPRIDDARLCLPARTFLVTDDRAIPRGQTPVSGTELDFRSERPIGSLELDSCFTDLLVDDDGWVRVRLAHPDGGPALTIAMDKAYQFVQLFTGDALDDPAARRRGVAIEPMSCAPNAFNSGHGLLTLLPGETWAGTWSVSVE